MHEDAIVPLALPQVGKHIAELIMFLPGVPSAGREVHRRGVPCRMPFSHKAAPRRFFDDLQEFPPALAKRGRPAEGRYRGHGKSRVRGRRHHKRLARQSETYEVVKP